MQLFFDILIALAVFMVASMAALQNNPDGPKISRITLIYSVLALAISVVIVYRSVVQQSYNQLALQRAETNTARKIDNELQNGFGIKLLRDSDRWEIYDTLLYQSRLRQAHRK